MPLRQMVSTSTRRVQRKDCLHRRLGMPCHEFTCCPVPHARLRRIPSSPQPPVTQCPAGLAAPTACAASPPVQPAGGGVAPRLAALRQRAAVLGAGPPGVQRGAVHRLQHVLRLPGPLFRGRQLRLQDGHLSLEEQGQGQPQTREGRIGGLLRSPVLVDLSGRDQQHVTCPRQPASMRVQPSPGVLAACAGTAPRPPQPARAPPPSHAAPSRSWPAPAPPRPATVRGTAGGDPISPAPACVLHRTRGMLHISRLTGYISS
jgi:hypothetical protein